MLLADVSCVSRVATDFLKTVCNGIQYSWEALMMYPMTVDFERMML